VPGLRQSPDHGRRGLGVVLDHQNAHGISPSNVNRRRW